MWFGHVVLQCKQRGKRLVLGVCKHVRMVAGYEMGMVFKSGVEKMEVCFE